MNKRKLVKMAKLLFKASLKGSFLDNTRILSIAKEIADSKIIGRVSLLKAYKRLIAAQIGKEEITIETPTTATRSPKLENLLLSKFSAKKVNWHQNEQIVVGAKITAGDWILDATLDAKLKQLSQAK